MAAGCDSNEYVGELSKLDSADLASPKLEPVSPPMNDDASTNKVRVPASRSKSKYEKAISTNVTVSGT